MEPWKTLLIYNPAVLGSISLSCSIVYVYLPGRVRLGPSTSTLKRLPMILPPWIHLPVRFVKYTTSRDESGG